MRSQLNRMKRVSRLSFMFMLFIRSIIGSNSFFVSASPFRGNVNSLYEIPSYRFLTIKVSSPSIKVICCNVPPELFLSVSLISGTITNGVCATAPAVPVRARSKLSLLFISSLCDAFSEHSFGVTISKQISIESFSEELV